MPQLDGRDRFDPSIGASFKSAGMLDFGLQDGGVREYFAQKTLERFKEAGIAITEAPAYALAQKSVPGLLTDGLEKQSTIANVRLVQGGKNVFRFPGGVKAEPEAALRILLQELAAMRGVKVLFDAGVVHLAYDDRSRWTCTTVRGKQFQGTKLVLAAGPQTKTLLEKHLKLTINTRNVLGVMAQSNQLAAPWLDGTILGAKTLPSEGCCCCTGGAFPARAYKSSMIGESETWATDLFLNVYDDRIYVGGPRILLKDRYSSVDVDPRIYQRHLQRCIAFAKHLVHLPTSNPSAQAWTGVMTFPVDLEYPLVGPVDRVFDERLFLNTAHASSGFREAYGAGILLGDVIVSGVSAVANVTAHDFQRDWRAVLPAYGSRVKRMK